MKILHTADWQIGIKAVGLGAGAAREVREERFRAAERVIEVAREHAVDAIIVAGDVFEHNGVDRAFVQRTADIVSAFEGPVYLLPGNHDALGPGSVWKHPCWGARANLKVLTRREPITALGAILYPCPYVRQQSDGNPLGWITPQDTDLPRIGIAHGSVEHPVIGESYALIAKDACQSAGLDYVALGHWHSFTPYADSKGVCRMAYSGTHEPTAYGERDSGQVLVVDIPTRGAKPDMVRVPTAGLTWLEMSRDLRTRVDLERLCRKLDSVPNPDRTLVRVTLGGILADGAGDILRHIESIVATRFLSARLDTRRLHPARDGEWVSRLPPGVIREAAEVLCAKGQSDGVAARAALELHALAMEELG